MRRCWGLTRNFRRCGRQGNWRLFCDDHRLQPIGWIVFLVFTVGAGVASYYSAWNKSRTNTSHPLPNQSELSEEIKLFIQCQRSFLPKLPPPGGTLYMLRPWALAAESGGGGLSELTTTSEFAWPTDKVGLPLSAYRCELTNYGKESVANVTLAPHLTIRKAIAQGNGQLNSGDVTISRDWPIVIGKIDPGKGDSFIFYAVNEYEHFLTVTFPSVATVAVMGDVRSRSVPLTHSGLDVMELGPFILGSQVTVPARVQPPAKTRPLRAPTQTIKGAQGGVTAGNITQGPGSIAQVGGIGNRASIINGPQLRFSERRIEELANLLSAHRGVVSIDVRNADSITNRDALNLLTAFAKAGWTTQGVNQLIHGTDIGADGLPIPDPTGIHIYARSERAALAESLKEALKKFGVETHVETDETVTGGDIKILVGTSD